MSGVFPRRIPWLGKYKVPQAASNPANWTRTQGTSTNNSLVSSISATYANPVVQGSLLTAVVFARAGTVTSVPVTDNQGNTWVRAAGSAKNATDGSLIDLWWAVSGGANTPTVTATANSGSPSWWLAINEWSPGSTPSSFTISVDGTNSAIFTSNTTTPSAGTIAVGGTNDLVLVGFAEGSLTGASSYTPGTGLTLDLSITVNPYGTTEYALNRTTAIAGAVTTSLSRPWDAVGVSFKAI